MPLYSDSNYYYSGGSSQLYSPYYSPGLYSSPVTSPTSSSYQPYSSTYNRSFGGSYVVPLTPPRTPSAYTSSHHGLTSSRYQPKLSTITETGAARHTSLMPLTRIQSPKFSTYTPTSTSTSMLPKYIAPRPIAINTADIDVSSSRYRQRREQEREEEERKHRQAEAEAAAEEEERKRDAERKANEPNAEETVTEPHHSRSTIKRNRAVVRLSTMRSRSKDRQANNEVRPSEALEIKKVATETPTESISWRKKLADDLAAIPTYPLKKTPGELLRERYLIQEAKNNDDEENERRRKAFKGIPETADKVLVELDPVDHSIRRLSIPQCPTFHDICEDISSDKIDDDLNAGELRRRASLIQEQEQELLNQLQKSASGSFQMINLERRDSVDSYSSDHTAAMEQRKSKRASKKGKKLRHKITAIVEVENHPALMPVLQETEESSTPANKELTPNPKFTFNVESVEEHHEIHKVFKLPKKKSVKKVLKPPKNVELPEGFVEAIPKPIKTDKKEKYVTTAEIFTFDTKNIVENVASMETPKDKESTESVLEMKDSKIKAAKSDATQVESPKGRSDKVETPKAKPATPQTELHKSFATAQKSPVTPQSETAVETVSEVPKPKVALKSKAPALKTSTSLDSGPSTPKVSKQTIEKSQSLTTMEVKSPTKSKIASIPEEIKEKSNTIKEDKVEKTETEISKDKTDSKVESKVKPIETVKPKLDDLKSKVKADQLKSDEVKPKTPDLNAKLIPGLKQKPKEDTATKKITSPKKTVATLKTSASLDGTATKPKASPKLQEKSQSLNVDETADTKVATPKPIRKQIEKSESGEDFWTQIGTRETLYMTNRKKNLIDNQQHEEIIEEQAAVLPSTGSTLQKIREDDTDSLKKSSEDLGKNVKKGLIERTQSNETTLEKKQSPQTKAIVAKKPVESSNAATKENTTKDKEKKSPMKINTGHEAKSPENNKREVASDKITTENALLDAKAKKKPEISAATTNNNNRGQMVTGDSMQPTATTTKVATATMATAATASTSAAKQSPTTTINADNFITSAPAKCPTPTTSPTSTTTKTTKKANASPTLAANKNKKRTDEPKAIATTPTTATATTTKAAATPPSKATTTTTTTTAKTSAADTQRAVDGAAVNEAEDGDNLEAAGKNLSKFATVSNLAQCLQDVDADLDDYIPTSAENSDCTDVSTDDDDDEIYSSANLSESMKKKLKLRRKQEKRDAKAAAKADENRFDPHKKVKIDTTNKCYVKDEAPRYPLVATPRPLWKREKIVYSNDDSDDDSDNSDDEDSDAESGSTEETDESEECTTSEEYDDEAAASGTAGTTPNKENSAIIRMSTCSNDSGFEGGTAPSSPKKMLECDVNCHKKCERLTANLCGVNQKLIVEALAHVKRGARGETRDSPSTPPSLNPAYKIETHDEHDETSYTYSQFQKSGRFTAPATVIPRFKNYSVDDFHFLTVLGKGSFGKVLLAELRDTTYYYAVKCLKKDVVLEDDDVDSTLIERKVLALGTKHPYLCHLFCTFQTESHLFFVMEYLNGGDLMFHIQESGRFSEERARFYGAEIISGLKFLHKKGIIYRDLKLDNVLLDYEGHVRIADFGMCKLQIYLDKTADSFCGTPDYMAPEIIKGEKYNQNVDWWSFGVLLYEMLIGQSPFSGCDEDELFWSICNEIPWFPVYISAEATSILKGLLEKDYTKRIGSQYSLGGDISEHIFFRPIDWNLLDKRQLEPPFKPQVKHPLDTQYFDRVFTRERVRLTPIDKEILQSMDQKQFHGFTYTNPHITLD